MQTFGVSTVYDALPGYFWLEAAIDLRGFVLGSWGHPIDVNSN